jgi:hypothetical protein
MLELSTGSGKMKGMCSLNTDTTSNDFCIKMKETDTICKSCYSWRFMSFRTNMVPRFKENSEILSKTLCRPQDFPRPRGLEVRFNSHGELINKLHLINLVEYAKLYPQVTFTLFTKRKDLVKYFGDKSKFPPNMILIYSNAKIGAPMKKLPKYFHKVFNVVDKKYARPEEVNCFGACVDCLKCYNTNDKTEQIIEYIK